MVVGIWGVSCRGVIYHVPPPPASASLSWNGISLPVVFIRIIIQHGFMIIGT